MTQFSQSDKELIDQLHLETAKIPWLELQRFFASGKLLLVDAEKDLLEVALVIAKNESDTVAQWINETVIQHPLDEQAKQWFEQKSSLWAVVIKPWVLIQEF